MGKKPFWSRDRLVKHEFDCLGLGLGLWYGYRIASELYIMVIRVGIRVYVKPFCTA